MEEEEGKAVDGEQMEGSETLLVKPVSWSLPPPEAERGWEELCSEPEDRLSTLRAGEQEDCRECG